MGTAQPGNLGPTPLGIHGPAPENGTTQVTVVDKLGNVVSMTTTVESGFGAFHMTRGGFLLNNQLTDFSAAPTDAPACPIANRVAAGQAAAQLDGAHAGVQAKADGTRGNFVMATGSPGGATIIQYVAKTLVGVLDWGMDAQQATSMIAFGAANSPNTNVGQRAPERQPGNGGNDDADRRAAGAGHTVNTAAQSSGIGTIVRARPRRRPSPGRAVPTRGAKAPRCWATC
jgi:gamma-glutamyltranspeptidase/glutathione hydrolase